LLIASVALIAGHSATNLLAGRVSSEPHALDDHGTFEIFAAGAAVGTETFEIRVRSNQIEAQGEVHLRMERGGRRIEVRTFSNLLLDLRLDPLNYTWSQKGSQSSQLSIDFQAQPVRTRYKTVNGQEDRRDFKLDKDVIVLDDNAVHQYQLAVARYDRTKGGTQTFRAFIPQEALPGTITLKSIGSDAVTVDGEKRTLQHFLLATELTQINLWVNDQDHLQLVSGPGNQYVAMRRR
jgi:hypothetical protein